MHFLNDFRWSSELIAWKEFLLLLERQEVHLPYLKNHYIKNICVKHDFPIFPRGKEKIAYIEKYQTTEDLFSSLQFCTGSPSCKNNLPSLLMALAKVAGKYLRMNLE